MTLMLESQLLKRQWNLQSGICHLTKSVEISNAETAESIRLSHSGVSGQCKVRPLDLSVHTPMHFPFKSKLKAKKRNRKSSVYWDLSTCTFRGSKETAFVLSEEILCGFLCNAAWYHVPLCMTINCNKNKCIFMYPQVDLDINFGQIHSVCPL